MHVAWFIVAGDMAGLFAALRYLVPGQRAENDLPVKDCREGGCADPGNPGKRDDILGTGGPAPPGKGEEQLLVPDSGGGET